jgi:hypothetical protein
VSSERVSAETPAFLSLQSAILNLTPETVDSTASQISAMVYLRDELHIAILLDLIFTLTKYRSAMIPAYSALICALAAFVVSNAPANPIRTAILERLSKPLRLQNSECLLLFRLMESSFFTREEFADCYDRFCRGDCRMPTGWMWFIPWFLPVIRAGDPVICELTMRHYVDIHRRTFADPVMKKFAKQVDDLPRVPVFEPWEIIKADDLDGFVEGQRAKRFRVTQTMPPSIFTLDPILQNFPNVAHLAAYLGAERCFDRLVQSEKLLLEGLDQAGVGVVGFAVAGGRLAILEKLARLPVEWDEAMHFAALYHRQEIFEFLVQIGRGNLVNRVTQRMGSVLHQCAVSANIWGVEFCVKNGADVNCRNRLIVRGKLIGHHCIWR